MNSNRIRIDQLYKTAEGWRAAVRIPSEAVPMQDHIVLRRDQQSTISIFTLTENRLSLTLNRSGAVLRKSFSLPLTYLLRTAADRLIFIYQTVSRNPRRLLPFSGRLSTVSLGPSSFSPIDPKKPVLIYVLHCMDILGAEQLALSSIKNFKERNGAAVVLMVLNGGVLEPQFRALADQFWNLQRDSIETILPKLKKLNCIGAICNTVVTSHICTRLAVETIRTIQLIHELPKTIYSQKAERKLLSAVRCADLIIFPTAFVKQRVLARLNCPENERMLTIPQGMYKQIALHSKEKSREQLSSRGFDLPLCPIILGVGDTTHRKGFDLFLELAKRADRQNRAVHFLWVGKRDESFFAKTGAEQGVPRFTFAGPTDDLSPFYGAADLMILTSREDPFPSVVMESLFAGKPVIAFENAGGSGELLNRISGTVLTVPDENIEAMERKITQLTESPELCRTIGEQGAQIIAEEYSFHRYTDRLWELLTSPKEPQ